MSALKAIYGIMSLFLVLPIWFYLLHSILIAIQASQFEWFLFWVYIPFGVLTSILQKIIESAAD